MHAISPLALILIVLLLLVVIGTPRLPYAARLGPYPNDLVAILLVILIVLLLLGFL